jgi:Holliday junction DNA helicase RuvA
MIYALKGKISEKKNTSIVVDVNGIFYDINVTINTIEKVDLEEVVLIKTVFIVREDSHALYGFLDEGEKELFQLLIQIKNIGPKTAIGILSSVKYCDLINYISEGNIALLSKLPGIGKKTAERLNIELKDKIDKFVIESNNDSVSQSNSNDEAVSALITLGFNRSIAQKAVSKALSEIGNSSNVEEIIKMSLKIVMK